MSEEKSELWLLDEEIIDKQEKRIAKLEAKLKAAEILLMDAQFCLQQKRAGQDENALACHIYKFLTENDDE